MFYLDLFRALNDHQVRYLVVGGLAMNLHGVPRMTMDIDLVLAMDEENLDRFIACAEQMKLAPVAPVNLVDLKNPQQRKQWAEEKHMVAFGLQAPAAGAPLLDILITPAIDVESALQRAVIQTVQEATICIAAVDDLIALKQAARRHQDMDDIQHLERLRGH